MRSTGLPRIRPQVLANIGLLLFLVNSGAAVAADDAGTMLFVKGTVSAERQPAVTLAKGDTVFVEDTIATGEAARAQILMLDGAKIAIRPNSRFRIEEFSYQAPGASAPVTSTSKDRSVSRLLKGGLPARSAKRTRKLMKFARRLVCSAFEVPTIRRYSV